MRLSIPLLPGDAGRVVEQMLTPKALALIAGTLLLWGGSHAFGVGEFIDAALLLVGFCTLGLSIFQGANEILAFTRTVVSAQSEADLKEAASHFAEAVTILGISVVEVVLLHGQARVVAERGMPRLQPRIKVGEPPPSGNQLRVSRPASLPDGNLGITDEYGVISVSRDQSLTEQRLTLLHEVVHRFFSPKTGPFRRLRAEINTAGYSRSALLRYLEEALAEGYAQLKVNGLEKAFQAWRFPIEGDKAYVTVAVLKAEGQAIGTITLGGTLFYVSLSRGKPPQPQ